MESNVKPLSRQSLRIGIVGAGFTGTAFAAELHRYAHQPLSIYLFEKTGVFAAGSAYGSPYPHHLLNARACDMSAFEDDPLHFVKWLSDNPTAKTLLDDSLPVAEQFVPRLLYRDYLLSLLSQIKSSEGHVELNLESTEIISVCSDENQITVKRHDGSVITLDKLVIATGNQPPNELPFHVPSKINCIKNPWNYTAIKHIATDDPVLIIGTGLSMIDVVLTLHHQGHRGKIITVSRHGLLPLPHTLTHATTSINEAEIPTDMRALMKWLRSRASAEMAAGGDWRAIINGLRARIPAIWQSASTQNKEKFLRHLLPYWNIHRHRVHPQLVELLESLIEQDQLEIIAGRVISAEEDEVIVRVRHSNDTRRISTKWLINCMGPSQHAMLQAPLIAGLMREGYATPDELKMGLKANSLGALNQNQDSSRHLYSLGPILQGQYWESLAVPEIRKQNQALVKHLLDIK